MYLITAYFDDITKIHIQKLIDKVCAASQNDYMIKNHVPPHMTICAFEQKSDDVAIKLYDRMQEMLQPTEVYIATIGVFLPYVIYAQVIKNEILMKTSQNIYNILTDNTDTKINHFYEPFNWIPHITIGKQLSKEQMQAAFVVMQEHFSSIEARIEKFSLSKPTPFRDLM